MFDLGFRAFCRRVWFGLVFGVLLFACFVRASSAQAFESGFLSSDALSDESKAQVVSRILKWYFAPSNPKKTIMIAGDGMRSEWLPRIEGIEFDLKPSSEISDWKDVVFFGDLNEDPRGGFSVVLGFGNPLCESAGDVWRFRLEKGKVRLWITEARVISNCGFVNKAVDEPPDGA
ncbi:MAG: hypothetical protein R2684_10060 [Pyrinomonadaceae bacterium]